MIAGELVHRLVDLRSAVNGEFNAFQGLPPEKVETLGGFTREQRVELYECFAAMEKAVCRALTIAEDAAL